MAPMGIGGWACAGLFAAGLTVEAVADYQVLFRKQSNLPGALHCRPCDQAVVKVYCSERRATKYMYVSQREP